MDLITQKDKTDIAYMVLLPVGLGVQLLQRLDMPRHVEHLGPRFVRLLYWLHC